MYILFNKNQGFVVYSLEDQPLANFSNKQQAVEFIKQQQNALQNKVLEQPEIIIRQKFEPTINMTNAMIDEQLYESKSKKVFDNEQHKINYQSSLKNETADTIELERMQLGAKIKKSSVLKTKKWKIWVAILAVLGITIIITVIGGLIYFNVLNF